MACADWMVHDWVVPEFGRTVIEEFLRRRGAGLSAREREYAGKWAASSYGLYEVTEIQPGVGMSMRDMLAGGERFVHDNSTSQQLVRWDCMLARVLPGERGWEMTGVGHHVPRRQVGAFTDWLEDECEASGLSWTEFFKRKLPRILERPAEICKEWRDNLRLVDTEGHELVFSKAHYRILDQAALRAALAAHRNISEGGEENSFDWLKTGDSGAGRTVKGHFEISGGQLEFSCNSIERLRGGKQLLKRIAGGLLEHLGDETTSLTLLREIENSEARKRKAGEAYYDIGRLRRELGM